MSTVVIVGNYLDPEGRPVIATQLPASGQNIPCGYATASGWVSRWIRAANFDVSQVFLHSDSGGLQFDHGLSRHVVRPGEWLVWTGVMFETFRADDFAAKFAAFDYEVEAP